MCEAKNEKYFNCELFLHIQQIDIRIRTKNENK